jgi:DNA-binding LacI/PurR family transcriptional regulator
MNNKRISIALLIDKAGSYDMGLIKCIIRYARLFSPDFTALGIPILVTPSKRLIPDVINIVADDEKIGELGARYVIDKGYKNLAF